jgi:hypothetical protein
MAYETRCSAIPGFCLKRDTNHVLEQSINQEKIMMEALSSEFIDAELT